MVVEEKLKIHVVPATAEKSSSASIGALAGRVLSAEIVAPSAISSPEHR